MAKAKHLREIRKHLKEHIGDKWSLLTVKGAVDIVDAIIKDIEEMG